MITFKINFLLAFSLKTNTLPKPVVKKKKTTLSKKNTSNTKTTTNTSSKFSKSEKLVELKNEIASEPKHVIQVGKPVGVAHIEYELVPNRCKYQFDVICWGPVAKIFTADGTKTLKTVVDDTKAWVPICLEHYMTNLALIEIEQLHAHVIEFLLFNTNVKLGHEAKADKSKVFYTLIEEAESLKFVDVFSEDPNNKESNRDDKDLQSKIRKIIRRCYNFPNVVEAVSYLATKDGYDDILYDIIDKVVNNIEIEYKTFVPICPPPTNDEDEVKDVDTIPGKVQFTKTKEKLPKSEKGKQDKKKKSRGENLKILIPGEVFFTDPNSATYQERSNKAAIEMFFINVKVKGLMTRSQKLFLNPLTIKIRKIINFPATFLENLGFTSIYVTYDIPYIAKCKTETKPIGNKMKFNESHIFFTHNVPKIKQLNFLSTQRVFMKIYGIRQALKVEIQPKIYNFQERNDMNKLVRLINISEVKKDSTHVLLAVASYDISSLMRNIWIFREIGQCHRPETTLFHNPSKSFFDNIFEYSINEINLIEKQHVESPLTEEMLLMLETNLQIECHLLAPQAASLGVHSKSNTFKRALVIVFDKVVACDFLNNIMLYNEKYIINIKNFNKYNKEVDGPDDIITGFVIDNGNNFVFYLEGLSNGYILNLWYHIDECSINLAKIYLNVDHIFETRLYGSFKKLGGMYFVTPKVPLQDIFKKQLAYVRGNMPMPCFEAFQKINLLFHSSTFKSILQYNLLPKPEELLSFNLEWGVPSRWREPEID